MGVQIPFSFPEGLDFKPLQTKLRILPWQMNNTFIISENPPKMHCPVPICSDLSRLFSGCNSLYSVTVFPKQGKMEQVTAGCSSRIVVEIVLCYYCGF